MPTAPLPDQPKVVLRRTIRTSRRDHVAAVGVAGRAAEAAALAEAAVTLVRGRLRLPPPLVAGDSRRRPGESPATDEADEVRAARGCVAAYESLSTEPPTEAMLAALRAEGLVVLVPVLLPDLDLDWHAVGDDRPLGRHAIAAAAVVLTPALSVDRHGVRLGQGGGSYDRALARVAPGALVVAVVNDHELVDGPLPHESHDARVDAVITPGRGPVRLPLPLPLPS